MEVKNIYKLMKKNLKIIIFTKNILNKLVLMLKIKIYKNLIK